MSEENTQKFPVVLYADGNSDGEYVLCESADEVKSAKDKGFAPAKSGSFKGGATVSHWNSGA